MILSIDIFFLCGKWKIRMDLFSDLKQDVKLAMFFIELWEKRKKNMRFLKKDKREEQRCVKMSLGVWV